MSDWAGGAAKQSHSISCFSVSAVTFGVWWTILAVFNRFPDVDLAIARSVFTRTDCTVLTRISENCGQFAYDKYWLFTGARSFLLVLPYIVIVILLATIVDSRVRPASGRKSAMPNVDMAIASLISLALGTGLLVNLLLKRFSGRPRPRETSLFGGQLDFVQAGSFAGKCIKNCSFISGEASAAGWLFCVVLILPPRLKLPIGIPLTIFSIAIPTMRVMTGAHYLSDALLGWLSSVGIFFAVLGAMERFTGRSYFKSRWLRAAES